MSVWRYDGSFAGLLSTLALLVARGKEPDDILPEASGQTTLFAAETVATDEAAAKDFLGDMAERIGRSVRPMVRRAFLSERPRIEMAIWRYLRLGLELGEAVNNHLADDAVRAVLFASRSVNGETHRYLGILRFRSVSGVLYAPLEPRQNILELLAPHFAQRLPNERWLIHDVKRRKAALHDKGVVLFADAPDAPLPMADDEDWTRLWQTYFDTIAIPERRNPKLQQHFIPKRVWKYLPEKEAR